MAFQTQTKTLTEMVDDVELELYRGTERPAVLTMGSAALTNGTDTSHDLTVGVLSATDVAQWDDELVLVTADVAGTYTVIRGFDGSSTTSHPSGTVSAGTVGYLNPQWPRHRIVRALKRALGSMSTWVPRVSNTDITVGADRFEELAADTMAVMDVRFEQTTGRVTHVGGWEFMEDLSSTISSTGKGLSLPSAVQQSDVLTVTRVVAYEWDDVSIPGAKTTEPVNADTLILPQLGEDLPIMYATAYMLAGREVSRTELDTVEDWTTADAIRQGGNIRLMRERWQDYYRRLDEVKRVVRPVRYRPFRAMPTMGRGRLTVR